MTSQSCSFRFTEVWSPHDHTEQSRFLSFDKGARYPKLLSVKETGDEYRAAQCYIGNFSVLLKLFQNGKTLKNVSSEST